MSERQLGVALGGGGILGAAHIGVLEVLQENGLAPDVITGTSAGSIVCALYAGGPNLSALREFSLKLRRKDIFTWNFSLCSLMRFILSNLRDMAKFLDAMPRGLFSGEKIGRLVEKMTDKRYFNEIPMPCGVVAADLITGHKVVFVNSAAQPQSQGTVFFQNAPLGAAVQASCAIPGIFEPVPYRGTLLTDGGLLEMVPASLARLLGAQVVVGVSLQRKGSIQEPQSPIQVVQRGINMMNLQSTKPDLDSADLVIEPLELDAQLEDFGRIAELLERGRQAALKALPDLKKLLS